MKRLFLVAAGAFLLSIAGSIDSYAQQNTFVPVKSKGSADRLRQKNEARMKVYPDILHFKHAKPQNLNLHPVDWAPRAVRLPQQPRRTVVPLNGTELLGNMVWANGWGDSRANYGMYSFLPQSPADFTAVHVDSLFFANGGGALIDGKYYFIERDDNAFYMGRFKATLYTYDADTWQLLDSVSLTEDQEHLITTETAVDNNNHIVYAVFHDGYENDKLGTIDYANRTRRILGDLQRGYVALGITSKGMLYGIAEDGNLYAINPTTVQELLIGATGLTVSDQRGSYQQSGEIDQRTNIFYWASMDATANAALYTVDLMTGKASLVANFPNGNQIFTLSIQQPYAASAAPAEVTGLQAIYTDGSTTGTIQFVAPDTTFGGNKLTDTQLDYSLVLNNDTLTGTTAPGQKVTVDETLPEGLNTIKAFVSNAAGKSPTAKLRKWIGLDTPDNVDSLKLTVADTSVELRWKAPLQGIHEGYIGQLKYDVVRYPDSVAVATGIDSTHFVETLATEDARVYTYGVTPRNNKYAGEEAISNKATGGTAYEVPYTQTFDSQEQFNTFTVVNVNNDSQYGKETTWEWNNDHFEWQKDFNPNARYYPSQKNAADDWLISPAIHMLPNRTYKVSWKGSKYWTEEPEVLEIKAGMGLAPADMTINVLPRTEFDNNDQEQFSQEMSVPEEGNYNVGFHIVSPANRSIFYIDDIAIEAGSKPGAPDSVTIVGITPDTTGELRAHVEITAPTKSLDGNSIDKLTEIDVLRNNETVHTFTDVAAGATVSFDDEGGIVNGVNRYAFVPANAEGNGRRTNASLFIGVDAPDAPANAKLADNDGALTVTWDKVPGVGANGHVVNTNKVWYTIYNMSAGYTAGSYNSTVLDSTQALTYTLGYNADDVEPGTVLYGVSAKNIAGTSAVMPTNTIIIGKPATLPFVEAFPCGRTDNWWWAQQKSARGFQTVQDDASNGDMGCVEFQPYVDSEAKLNTCKVTLKGATRPMIAFDYYAYPGKKLELAVDIMRPNGDIERIGDINYADLTGDEGWRKALVSIDANYTNDRYDIFMFYAYNNDTRYPVKFDNVRIADFKDKDAQVSNLSCPEHVIKGHTAPVSFDVDNTGLQSIDNYYVRMSINGEEVVDSLAPSSLESLKSAKFTLNYVPSVMTEGDNIAVKIEVLSEYSVIASADGTIALVKSERAPVENLASTDEGGRRLLTWTAPAASETSYTETFDSYDPWATAFGDWTNVDKDGGSAGSISGSLSYPGQDEPLAFLVFNPNKLDKGIVYNTPNLAPHSGSQYLAAVYSVDRTKYWNPQYMKTNDWLYSPQLSGKAQTIRFYANYQKNSDSYGRAVDSKENYDVLYSTTTKDSAEFKLLASDVLTEQGWAEKEYNLPDGAKYFAINHNTGAGDGFMFLIDDVTFNIAGGTPVAYNVYADGDLIATVKGVGNTSFDISDLSGDVDIAVTAVYDDGLESEPVRLGDANGINVISVDGQQVRNIYGIDGMKVPSDANIRPGIYIVNGKKRIIKR